MSGKLPLHKFLMTPSEWVAIVQVSYLPMKPNEWVANNFIRLLTTNTVQCTFICEFLSIVSLTDASTGEGGRMGLGSG